MGRISGKNRIKPVVSEFARVLGEQWTSSENGANGQKWLARPIFDKTYFT